MKILFTTMLGLPLRVLRAAEIHTEAVEYKHGDATLEGWLALRRGHQGQTPRRAHHPPVKGLTDYEKKRAEMLAGLGYTVFAVDIYGKRAFAEGRAGSRRAGGQIQGGPANSFARRARAGLDVLAKNEFTDPNASAAIGYCFGARR